MKLRGGFSASRRKRNFSSAARKPSTSMKTPCGELLTQPVSFNSSANRKTNGRKPTPCTAPRTAIFRRELEVAGWRMKAIAVLTGDNQSEFNAKAQRPEDTKDLWQNRQRSVWQLKFREC